METKSIKRECIPGTQIPKPKVELIGQTRNVFSILGRCLKALRQAGASTETLNQFKTEAISGDYDNAIQTAMKFCDVS